MPSVEKTLRLVDLLSVTPLERGRSRWMQLEGVFCWTGAIQRASQHGVGALVLLGARPRGEEYPPQRSVRLIPEYSVAQQRLAGGWDLVSQRTQIWLQGSRCFIGAMTPHSVMRIWVNNGPARHHPLTPGSQTV